MGQTEKVIDLPQATIEAFDGDILRARTFYEKYALRDRDGNIIEKTPQEMWRRISTEIANADPRRPDPSYYYSLLEDFKFVPGGRIMFGVGQSRRSTLSNCYTISINEDSLEGIFDWCKEAARTYSLGGGVGVDISILRPKGSPVNNSALYSTGAVSFMDLFSKVTSTIGQNFRRGALMITIDVSHPDVEDFIEVKNDPEHRNVRAANISIKITDEFMNAVINNAPFELHYGKDKEKGFKMSKLVDARSLWNKIIRSARNTAEPGIIFWDNVVNDSPSEYNGMNVYTTNPCAELPLDPYSNCCLGSINLSKFVDRPFTDKASFCYTKFMQVTEKGVNFLDSVLSYNEGKHPLPRQEKASMYSRRIGLGLTGLGDMLAQLKLPYDSQNAIDQVDTILRVMRNVAYQTSISRAKALGSFLGFNAEKHLQMGFIKHLPPELKRGIREQGLRNVVILTVPPVGTGSVVAGCSSGIEPIFALSYNRRSETLSEENYLVLHPLFKTYCQNFDSNCSLSNPPNFFRIAHEINPMARVKMQATIQQYIDSSLSSTINLPHDVSMKEVDQIYFQAWKQKLKGVTIYREGSREGILSTIQDLSTNTESEVEKQVNVVSEKIDALIELADDNTNRPWTLEGLKVRPEELSGKTHKIRTGHGNMYIVVNCHNNHPVEVFINIGKSGASTTADAEALGRVISLALRSGVPVNEVVSQLKDIGGDRQITANGQWIRSVPDAVAKILTFYINQENSSPELIQVHSYQESFSEHLTIDTVPDFCKKPNQCEARHEGGCITCLYCHDSKC